MEKKHVILIAILVIIIIILAGAILLNINPLQKVDNNAISISSDDSSVSGKLMICEWSDVKSNENGTYNITQFISKYGGNEGTTNDIIIKDGKAEYTLRNDTDFFMVSPLIKDINQSNNNSEGSVKVEYLHNGKSLITSSNKISIFRECKVSFGSQIYSTNGTKLSDSDVIIDSPELKTAFQNFGLN